MISTIAAYLHTYIIRAKNENENFRSRKIRGTFRGDVKSALKNSTEIYM